MRSRRTTALAGAVILAAAWAGPASAGDGTHPGDRAHPGAGADRAVVHPLVPSTHGNPEGVAWDRASQSFFVGATGDGTIYRGRLHQRAVRPFVTVPPAAGRAAIGMDAVGGRLYVAGGPTGAVFVYRIRTGALVARFDTGPGGFLNDLVVTKRGDVIVTDSFRPVLWRIAREQLRAGRGVPRGIALNPEIPYVPGEFNLNGIEQFPDGRLLAISSTTGLLYRITLDPRARGGRSIVQLAAPPVVGGDGLLWDQGRLVVVTGAPARLTYLAVQADLTEAVITATESHPALRGPSTLARARHRYLVVNADFATSATPFTVANLPAPHGHPEAEIPRDGDDWLGDDLKARH